MSRSDLCLLVAGAFLLTLAFPPFHLFVPSFVCLLPAVLLIERGNNDRLPLHRQVQFGFLFGLFTNGLLLYWMVSALWQYTSLSLLGYASTVLLLSAYCAGVFALCGWIVRAAGVSILVAFPVLWTALEWVLAHQFDLRFPWLGLGTSLTGYPTVVQIADVVGARGVTFLLALANTALALAWIGRRRRKRAIGLCCAVGVGIVLASGYGLVRENTIETRPLGEVALIQPNVGTVEKWDRTLQDGIIASLIVSSEDAHVEVNPDLIVWPEAAVPGDLERRTDWRASITSFSRRVSTPMVIGGLHSEVLADSTVIRFNAAFVFDSAGRGDGYPIYHKQYLVPITERVPFLPRSALNLPWFGSFASGDAGTVYRLGFGSFGVLICYESAFEDLARIYRMDGADFLVNITNDAWFGRTTTPYQHASHLVMRAIENRVGIARAANTGISEFVDPFGREYERTELAVETYAFSTVKTSDVLTLYSRLGDWVGGTVILMSLILIGYAWWRKRQPL